MALASIAEVVAICKDGYYEGDCDYNPEQFVAIGAALALPWALSAGFGARWSSRCRKALDAHQRWVRSHR